LLCPRFSIGAPHAPSYLAADELATIVLSFVAD
jgi:hypothetical protein